MGRLWRWCWSVVVAVVAVAAVTVAAPVGVSADGNEAPGNPAAFRSISAGGSRSCALLEGGLVDCWGSNTLGQLGLGDGRDRGDDPGEMGDNLRPVNLGTGRTATAIAAGGEHTCALLADGAVKCWGLNLDGRLGLGDTQGRGGNPGEMGENLPTVDLVSWKVVSPRNS